MRTQRIDSFPGPAWRGWDTVDKVIAGFVLASKAAAVFLVLFVLLWCFFSLPL